VPAKYRTLIPGYIMLGWRRTKAPQRQRCAPARSGLYFSRKTCSLSPPTMKSPTSHCVRYTLLGAFLLGALFSSQAHAQNPPPRISAPAASPPATLKQRVGFTDVEVTYSRPGMKGRKVFGGLTPLGELWRTGANAATKVTFSTPVKINGTELPAGAYALFSIPDRNEWTVIFNRATGDWGAYSYKAENDVLRVKARPVRLAQPVETFTIDINDIRTESATLNLIWENTRVPVTFEVGAVQQVVAQIDSVIASGATLTPREYYTAAMFYYDHNLDLKKARTWVEEATKGADVPFFMLHGKAKILAKLGDKPGAIAAAKQSMAAARGGSAEAEYKRLNEALIASLR
jgi:hypothetical protein